LLFNGEGASFGEHSTEDQYISKADFDLDEQLKTIIFYRHPKGIAGVKIQTNKGLRQLGSLNGEQRKLCFENATLSGVRGKVEGRIVALGISYRQPDDTFYYRRPLPQQSLSWTRDSNPLGALQHSIHRPFEVIKEITWFGDNGGALGIKVVFSDGNTASLGDCGRGQAINWDLNKKGVAREVNLYRNNDMYLVCAGGSEMNTPSLSIAAGQYIEGQCIAVQSGWTDGKLSALALLFTAPLKLQRVGYLPQNPSQSGFCDYIATNSSLHSLYAYSDDKGINGIGLSFKKTDEIQIGAMKGESYTSFLIPPRATRHVIKTGTNADSFLTSVHYTPSSNDPTQNYQSSKLGNSVESFNQDISFTGSVVGAYVEHEGDKIQFGLISEESKKFLPFCGNPEGSEFFETDCVYSVAKHDRKTRVTSIKGWFGPGAQKVLQGIQILTTSSAADAFHVYDIGRPNGQMSVIDLPEGFAVKYLDVAIIPLTNRQVSGIRVIGTVQNGNPVTSLVGKMLGDVYRHEPGESKVLEGVFGTTHEEGISSIGFSFCA